MRPDLVYILILKKVYAAERVAFHDSSIVISVPCNFCFDGEIQLLVFPLPDWLILAFVSQAETLVVQTSSLW